MKNKRNNFLLIESEIKISVHYQKSHSIHERHQEIYINVNVLVLSPLLLLEYSRGGWVMSQKVEAINSNPSAT